MPVGAGGEALRRIEAALTADDPALAESFRRWREPPGTEPGDGAAVVGKSTGLVLLLGLVSIAVGPVCSLVLLVLGAVLFLGALHMRKADRR